MQIQAIQGSSNALMRGSHDLYRSFTACATSESSLADAPSSGECIVVVPLDAGQWAGRVESAVG